MQCLENQSVKFYKQNVLLRFKHKINDDLTGNFKFYISLFIFIATAIYLTLGENTDFEILAYY